MEVNETIRKVRKELGKNQEDVADFLGMDSSNYGKIERGIQKLTVEDLAKIADFFDMRIIDFFTYPKKFIDADAANKAERISVTFEISPDKRDILLNLVRLNSDKLI